jgi:hypothetical protein
MPGVIHGPRFVGSGPSALDLQLARQEFLPPGFELLGLQNATRLGVGFRERIHRDTSQRMEGHDFLGFYLL